MCLEQNSQNKISVKNFLEYIYLLKQIFSKKFPISHFTLCPLLPPKECSMMTWCSKKGIIVFFLLYDAAVNNQGVEKKKPLIVVGLTQTKAQAEK